MSGHPVPQRAFVLLVNKAYNGKDFTPLNEDVIIYQTTSSKIAKCGTTADNVFFACNEDWWNNVTPGKRIGLLCHEVAHLIDTNHSPEFWEEVTNVYQTAESLHNELETLLDTAINFAETRDFLVHDPSTATVDNRTETAYECRKRIANEIGYNGDITPFSNMRIVTGLPDDDEIQLENIEWTEHELKDIINYFHNQQQDGLRKENEKYVIQPVPVTDTSGTYKVVELDVIAELAARTGQPALPVTIIE